MDKRTINAIKNSIEHWKRMIKWAKKQNKEHSVYQFSMKKIIKESWFTDDCKLCIKFKSDLRGCGDCPLDEKYGRCTNSNSGNAWSKVNASKKWGMWVKKAEIMLKQLESLLEE